MNRKELVKLGIDVYEHARNAFFKVMGHEPTRSQINKILRDSERSVYKETMK